MYRQKRDEKRSTEKLLKSKRFRYSRIVRHKIEKVSGISPSGSEHFFLKEIE